MMLQQEYPEDCVIATGSHHSIRDFLLWTANEPGIKRGFRGKGSEEYALIEDIRGDIATGAKLGQVVIRIHDRYFRPSDVPTLLGDASKARAKLGWEPKISAQEMCSQMVAEDLKNAKRRLVLREQGLEIPPSIEI